MFTVTYRNKSGAKAEVEIEAASRAECVAECKTRGITPMGIRDGRAQAARRQAAKGQDTQDRHDAHDRRRTISLGVLGVLGVLALGTWWWLAGARDTRPYQAKPPAEKPKVASRPEAQTLSPREQPSPAPVATNRPPAPEDERTTRLKRIREKYGDNIPDNLKAVVYFLEHPPKKTFKAQGAHGYFRHPSERQIAGVVFTEPGTYFVMKPEFGEAFDRDFANALVDKIEPNDDDSEEVRQAKEAMRDVKKEIAEMCGAQGKKPSEVMNEQATAMYELGLYQRNLEEELDKIHANPELSDKDVEDFCRAANELLASKGLPPMPLPNLARRGIQLKHAQRRAELKAAKETSKGASK